MAKYTLEKQFEAFLAAKESLEAARAFFKRAPTNRYILGNAPSWLDTCTEQQLQNFRAAAQKYDECAGTIRAIDEALTKKSVVVQTKDAQAKGKTTRVKKFAKLQELTARALIEHAEELTSAEIGELLAWEQENKNRALVVRELSTLLEGGEMQRPTRSESPDVKRNEFINIPNPFDAENKKVMKKGKGTLRLICIDCGVTNHVDVAQLREVIERRNNTKAGRLSAWSDRQIEAGSRLTGRHAAAELSRANQRAIANQVQQGFPCIGCGNSLVR